MKLNQVVFNDRQEFIQAAFNEVARIVSEHGNAAVALRNKWWKA